MITMSRGAPKSLPVPLATSSSCGSSKPNGRQGRNEEPLKPYGRCGRGRVRPGLYLSCRAAVGTGVLVTAGLDAIRGLESSAAAQLQLVRLCEIAFKPELPILANVP